MGFENFGTVSFTTETKAADFVSYLEQGKVMTTKCKKCGTRYFPPKMDCPKCLLSDVEWSEIKGDVKLISYTTVHYGPSGFEDGLRIFSRLSKNIKESDIKPGMKLKVVPIKLPGDRISYEFQQV